MPEIQLLAGSPDYTSMRGLQPYAPFSNTVQSFLAQLSRQLMDCTAYPDIVTFAFFCRRAHLDRLKQSYEGRVINAIGRGVSFHIAPSNVPINFAYSLVAGLLAGNACIVRVSSKPFPQTLIVCNFINLVLGRPEFDHLRNTIAVIQYAHNADITAQLSGLCDVRVIWGGDETIREIRKAPLPARSFDLTFADRYSVCLIEAKNYLNTENKNKVARDFYNDTYLFDQNACSSPRLIYWVGSDEDAQAAMSLFWSEVLAILDLKGYTIDPITAVNKYTTSCRAAMDMDGTLLVARTDNRITRIALQSLPDNLPDYASAGGCYFEYVAETPANLFVTITRKYQTLTYLGFDPKLLVQSLKEAGVCGIDRVVPIGRAADFNLVWDGYDMIHTLSRTIDIV